MCQIQKCTTAVAVKHFTYSSFICGFWEIDYQYGYNIALKTVCILGKIQNTDSMTKICDDTDFLMPRIKPIIPMWALLNHFPPETEMIEW